MSATAESIPTRYAPTASQLAMAASVCRGIARSAAKNFYYGFMVLPRRKQNALCAVYAFMRRCDDITDDPGLPLNERREKLAAWIAAVHRAVEGVATDEPVLLALADAQQKYKIPVELLDQLAYGTAADLCEPWPGAGLAASYRTFDDLMRYCYGVASVVGLVCIRIFGYRDPAAEPLAARLGQAFQLTNILRDVKEDAEMGRVYLPEEDLTRFGVAAASLREPDKERLRPLLAMEADRAREFYRAGQELLPLIDDDSQPALWVLMTIYSQLLEKIAARNYDVFTEKVRLSAWQKVAVLGRGFVKHLF